jgi:hypothetical protein
VRGCVWHFALGVTKGTGTLTTTFGIIALSQAISARRKPSRVLPLLVEHLGKLLDRLSLPGCNLGRM